MNATAYVFVKVGDHYEFIKDNQVYTYSKAMLSCMDRQYRIMGFREIDIPSAVIYIRFENEVEKFWEKFQKRLDKHNHL